MVNTTNNKQSGFSLIQLMIVIVIASIGLATAARLSTIQFQQDREQKIDQDFENINDLLLTYYTGHQIEYDSDGNATQVPNRRLPCPARRDLTIDHPDFGKEQCNSNITVVETDIINPDDTSQKLRVLIGALPVRELTTSTKNAFDVFDSQFLYAVSAEMTNEDNFGRTDMASISYIERSDEGIDQTTPLPFIVVSAGETGRGAYGENGKLTEECPTSGNENENCDDDFVFLDTGIQEKGDANAFFDDRLGFNVRFLGEIARFQIPDFNCPSGDAVIGFLDGQPVCDTPTAPPPTGGPTFGGACGQCQDGAMINGRCIGATDRCVK